jgi:predicted DNA-binding protein (MmcQ/YjbR family)
MLRMEPEALRDMLLGFPGATEAPPFFKVAGKVFAIAPLGGDERPLLIGLKCDPELAEALRANPAIRPGYANRIHWNTVVLGGSLDDGFVRELVEDSYDLVVSGLPRRLQRELGWSASG